MFADKLCQSKRKTKVLLRDDFHLQIITFWLLSNWFAKQIPSGLVIARRSLAIYLDAFNSPPFLLEFRRITDSRYQPAIPRDSRGYLQEGE